MKLDVTALSILAAIFGISNMGQDHFFRDHGKKNLFGGTVYSPESAYSDYIRLSNKGYDARTICDSTVNNIAGSLFENDEQQQWFQDEARSWIKILRKMKPEKIKKTWPDFAKYVDVLMETNNE